jgi:hypothetical protein
MRSLIVPLVAFAACSSGTNSDGGTPTADSACTALAAARCNKQQQCEPATVTFNFGDVATCTAREKIRCLNSLAANGTGNTAATVQGCADAYPAWTCPDYMNSIFPPACRTQVGTQANGSGCAFSSQCTSAFCAFPTGAACGACAPAQVVGSPCGGGIGCAGNGLYCDSASQTCQSLVTSPGYFCEAGSCGYLLGCVMPLDGGAGTCEPLVSTLDAGCDAQQHNAAACAAVMGFACVARHCVADIFVSVGQPCGTDRDAGIFHRCSAGGFCAGDAGATTCMAPAGEGFDCDTALGIDCVVPARCVSTNGLGTDGGPVLGKCALPSGTVCQ